MKCSHIVECLRANGTEPTATSKSHFGSHVAAIGLEYSTQRYFCSRSQNTTQWWIVDFKQVVSITSYQIKAGNIGGRWVSGWTFSVSLDNSSWIVADSPPYQEPGDTIFKLSKTNYARYVKIEGSAALYTGHNDKTDLAFYYIKFFGSLDPFNHQHDASIYSKRNVNKKPEPVDSQESFDAPETSIYKGRRNFNPGIL